MGCRCASLVGTGRHRHAGSSRGMHGNSHVRCYRLADLQAWAPGHSSVFRGRSSAVHPAAEGLKQQLARCGGIFPVPRITLEARRNGAAGSCLEAGCRQQASKRWPEQAGTGLPGPVAGGVTAWALQMCSKLCADSAPSGVSAPGLGACCCSQTLHRHGRSCGLHGWGMQGDYCVGLGQALDRLPAPSRADEVHRFCISKLSCLRHAFQTLKRVH